MVDDAERSRFCTKTGYRQRSVVYPVDRQVFSEDVVRHPDAYALAGRLATRFGADNIIDIGLGSPRQLMSLAGFRKIGIAFGSYLEVCRRQFSEDDWIEWNLETDRDLPLADEIVNRSIVICSGAVERLADPTNFLNMLSRLSRRAPAMIVTTTERDLLHGADHMGPPTDVFHMREWNAAEFEQMLRQHGLRPTITGLTVDDDEGLEKKTIISIFDQCPLEEGRSPPDFRPIALVTTYNDIDIAAQTIAKLLDDGINVLVQDNWSTDGTFEQLTALAAERSDLSVARFPEQEQSRYFDLRTICRMKEEIAAKYPGRWIIPHDSDEIRCSPWAGISLRGGLYIAERMGFTAIDFTVCEFRPVDDGFSPASSLERQIRHFEYSRVLGHFSQIKVWRQDAAGRVDLASSGGHEAQFPGRKIFPYKFLLKHYPLRSPEQARRKVFVERRPRYAPQEREMGWHTHYDKFKADQRFIWNAAELIDFEAAATRRTYLLESITGIGIIRNTADAPLKQYVRTRTSFRSRP